MKYVLVYKDSNMIFPIWVEIYDSFSEAVDASGQLCHWYDSILHPGIWYQLEYVFDSDDPQHYFIVEEVDENSMRYKELLKYQRNTADTA